MNYFANILKFPYESNISTTFLLYFLKPEIYIKSAQEYYNSIFNLENIEKLDISPEEKKELISIVEKDNNSKNKSFFKTLGLRLGISGGIFGGSFGILTLVNRWYKYKKENYELSKQLKEETHDVLTNERKTYYEDQQNDVLNFYYYYFLFTIYVIIVICFGVFSLIYPSLYNWKIRCFIFLLFAVLPFISTWLLGKIIQILYWLFNLLPKNVYK
jgi:hypothetical protein